jgi:hypothetical protein
MKRFQIESESDGESISGSSSSGGGNSFSSYFKFNLTISKLLEILFVVIICIGFVGNVINIYIFSKKNM